MIEYEGQGLLLPVRGAAHAVGVAAQHPAGEEAGRIGVLDDGALVRLAVGQRHRIAGIGNRRDQGEFVEADR